MQLAKRIGKKIPALQTGEDNEHDENGEGCPWARIKISLPTVRPFATHQTQEQKGHRGVSCGKQHQTDKERDAYHDQDFERYHGKHLLP